MNTGALDKWLHLQFSRQEKEEVRSKTCKSLAFLLNFRWRKANIKRCYYCSDCYRSAPLHLGRIP